MRRTVIGSSFAIGLALGGCATPTLVDMTDVNPVTYQRDLDRCQAIAPSADRFGPVVVGAIVGATVGMAAGAVAYPTNAISVAEGYGAAAGAVAGAGTVAVADAVAPTPPAATPEETRSVADCLRAHGYMVLGQAPAAKP